MKINSLTVALLLALAFPAQIRAAPMYDIQLLGTLAGGPGTSVATDINNAGQAVGYSSNADFGIEAFVWDSTNGMQGLGVEPGSSSTSFAWAINENGQVVGTNDWSPDGGATRQREAFVWDSTSGQQGLGSLNPDIQFSEGQDINEAGQVIGLSRTVYDPGRVIVNPDGSTTTGYAENNVFLWEAGVGMTDLGQPASAGTNLFDTAINDNGDLVADLHRGNTIDGVDVDPSIEINSGRVPTRIENDGRIPLYGGDATPGFWNPDGSFTPLAADQPGQFGAAVDVNALDQVIGFRADGGFSGSSFLFADGEFFELTDLINGDFFLFFAMSINDHGQIAGQAFSSTDFNIVQAAILTPVPTDTGPPSAVPLPSTSLLMISGLLALFVARRRLN